MDNNSSNNNYVVLPKGAALKNGRYVIEGTIGEGGFGITYKAFDVDLRSTVAIKEYFPTNMANRDNRESNELKTMAASHAEEFNKGRDRFLEEARSVAQFRNKPGIVCVYDYFTENRTAYMVMEFIEGDTLMSRIKKRQTFTSDEMLELMGPFTKALSMIHEEGVIHRDISPDNIKIGKDGALVLIDFGAARNYSLVESKSLSIIVKPMPLRSESPVVNIGRRACSMSSIPRP